MAHNEIIKNLSEMMKHFESIVKSVDKAYNESCKTDNKNAQNVTLIESVKI